MVICLRYFAKPCSLGEHFFFLGRAGPPRSTGPEVVFSQRTQIYILLKGHVSLVFSEGTRVPICSSRTRVPIC